MAIVSVHSLESAICQEGTDIFQDVLAVSRQPHGRISTPPELSGDDKPSIIEGLAKSQWVEASAFVSG